MGARIQNPRVPKDLTISLSLGLISSKITAVQTASESLHINNHSWNPAILAPLLYRENAVGRATDRQIGRRAVPFGPQNQLGIAPPFVRTLFAHQIRQSLQQPFVGIGLQPLPPALWTFPPGARHTKWSRSPCRLDSPFSRAFRQRKCQKEPSIFLASGGSPYFVGPHNRNHPPSGPVIGTAPPPCVGSCWARPPSRRGRSWPPRAPARRRANWCRSRRRHRWPPGRRHSTPPSAHWKTSAGAMKIFTK